MALPTRNTPAHPNGATRGFVLTKSDSTTFPATRAVYVGGAGDINVVFEDEPGVTVLLSAVPAGTMLPIRITQLYSASTSATLVCGLW